MSESVASDKTPADDNFPRLPFSNKQTDRVTAPTKKNCILKLKAVVNTGIPSVKRNTFKCTTTVSYNAYEILIPFFSHSLSLAHSLFHIYIHPHILGLSSLLLLFVCSILPFVCQLESIQNLCI